MTRSLVGLELETGGVLVKYLQTTVETNGALHVQEARYPARSPLPPYHRHPFREEHFSVVEGEVQFNIAGERRLVRAGESVRVPPRTFHNARNPADVPALVIWETRPALRTAEFFYAMSQASRGRAKPRLADAAAILREFRDELELAKPSLLVQRIVFGCLAPFGRVPR